MIRKIITAALLASSASVAAAQEAPATVQPPVVEIQPVPAAPAAAPAPAVDPARLAAARSFVDAALPQSLIERAIALGVHQAAEEHRRDPAEIRRDPNLAERSRIMERVISEEMGRILRDIDPGMRSVVSDFYARRLSQADLEEGARFYGGPMGRRFYEGAINMALSPEYEQAMQSLAPHVQGALAGADQRYAAATADLAPFPGERRPAAGASSSAPPAPRAAPAAPALPAVDPDRLAAGRRLAEALWPPEMFREPFNLVPMLETVMAMRVGDLGVPIPPQWQIDPNATFGEIATTYDPQFSRRVPVLARFGAGEIARVGTAIEPEWKRIAAVFYAREFSVAELEAMAGFFASPAGRRITVESYRAIEDSALVRGTIQLLPRVALQLPAAFQRVEQATAHLPPPAAPGSGNGRRNRRDRR
jgi:hypothetical protein